MKINHIHTLCNFHSIDNIIGVRRDVALGPRSRRPAPQWGANSKQPIIGIKHSRVRVFVSISSGDISKVH